MEKILIRTEKLHAKAFWYATPHERHPSGRSRAAHGALLAVAELRLGRQLERGRLRRDHVHEGAALLPREDVRAAVIATAAASGVREGSMRFWMSAGQGGFGLSPKECVRTNLYVVAVDRETPPAVERGWTLATSGVAIKPLGKSSPSGSHR